MGIKDASKIWEMIGGIVERRAGLIVIATVVMTIPLLIPMLVMTPDMRANITPGGEVFELNVKLQDRMPSANLYTSFIAESKDGDMLTQECLLDLYESEEALRSSSIGRDYLVSRYDVDTGTWNAGIYTIADAVNEALSPSGGLKEATDDSVKTAIAMILSTPEGRSFRDSFSIKAWNETRNIGNATYVFWCSPALVMNTYTDNAKVEEIYAETLEGVNEESVVKEHFNRELQEILRGEGDVSYDLWGIAIDVNLEAEDEGEVSFMLIMVAIVLILVIVLVIFRSLTVFLLTSAGILMMIVWLKGLANLVGLNSSLTIDIIVPVSILVLGVDYAIHAIHRYEEERGKVQDARKALGNGMAGVGGALFLAMITTVAAFSSNLVSDIEEIVGFGVAASLAILAAYWIMGFFMPSAKMLLDTKFGKGRSVKGRKGNAEGSSLMGRIVTTPVKAKTVLLTVILLLSIGAGYLALQLEAQLDVKEYFDPDSDFVVSLDKLDQHLGDRGGEPAIFYIEGDLSEPMVLKDIVDFERSFSDNEMVARDQFTGDVVIYMDLLGPLRRVFENPFTLESIVNGTGVDITASDGDFIPDTSQQMRAVLSYMHEHGLPLNSSTMMYDTAQVREFLWIDPEDPTVYATIVMTGVPNTRELKSVQDSEVEFREDMEVLDDPGIRFVGLTGSGYERDRTLTAITESLNLSIAVAVVLCFVVLVVMFRSFKFALVTVIPEILVAAWLYAIMYLGGYHLNAVTATIAAISIGVGIDYSVHVTARYRQELGRTGDRISALDKSARHTGVALLGSAASTMIGFAVIGFAPMPMFSSYGILTSIMIGLAFMAALLVLPSLLVLVTTGKDLAPERIK